MLYPSIMNIWSLVNFSIFQFQNDITPMYFFTNIYEFCHTLILNFSVHTAFEAQKPLNSRAHCQLIVVSK